MLKPEHNLKPVDIKRFVRQESVNFKVPKIVSSPALTPYWTNKQGLFISTN